MHMNRQTRLLEALLVILLSVGNKVDTVGTPPMPDRVHRAFCLVLVALKPCLFGYNRPLIR